MARLKTLLTAILPLFLFHLQLTAQTDGLPRSTPEAEGVSSAGIQAFLDAAKASKHEFHSIMFLRHGKVIAEGWWGPYGPNLKHTMYSTSKSFTATAVGFAVSEKLLKLDDKVVSFFPNDLPDTVSPNLAALTVKDVLIMSDGQEPDPTFAVASRDSNWVKGFLSTPVLHKPGSRFLYNSLGTYMLSALVQKVTGQKVIDYLRPRLFEPLGITGMDWEVDPRGINTGGWGLRIKTSDMAKFGQLFLQKGKWNGKQVLPEGWVEQASTASIMQEPDAPQSKKDSSDWLQGYCYQMWRCRHNGYRADGAFGQFIIVLPQEDAVVAITAETPDMQGEINLVWQHLLPAMKKGTLTADKTASNKLQQTLSSLALPFPGKASSSPIEKQVAGKSFVLNANDGHYDSLSFSFDDGKLLLKMHRGSAVYSIPFGSSQWAAAETEKEGPYLVAAAKARGVGLPPAKVMGAYQWLNENTLQLVLRYIESPHTETITCQFEGNNLSAETRNSFSPNNKTVVTGTYR